MRSVKNNLSDRWSPRAYVVYMVALSVSLPIAFISISKLVLFTFGLTYLGYRQFRNPGNPGNPGNGELWIFRTILLSIFVFFSSLIWTTVEFDVAAQTLVKHSKILTVLILIILIRSEKEARNALIAFAVGQTFLLASSWSLAAGLHPLWAFELDSNGDPRGPYVVYSSYLDQSIIFATVAGIFFHLQSEKIWTPVEAWALTLAALANVLLLLPGRTGYVIAIAVVSLAVIWLVPRRFRLSAAVAVPILVLAILAVGSSRIRDRISKIVTESTGFAQQTQTDNSSGWRLNAWHRSLQGIAERPVMGHGVGSWISTVKRLEGVSASVVFGDSNSSNPHQEYLLWGVEYGVGGTILLVAVFFSFVKDSLAFRKPVARATISVTVALSVACLFNSALYDGLVGDFFCVTLGLLMSYGLQTKLTSQEHKQQIRRNILG